MIRDQLGSSNGHGGRWRSVIGVMLLIVTRFNPKHYADHIR